MNEPQSTLQKCGKAVYISFLHLGFSNLQIYTSKLYKFIFSTSNAEFYNTILEILYF
jgi:hypothetical protein